MPVNSQEYFILNIPYLFHVEKICSKERTQDIFCPLDLYLTKYIILKPLLYITQRLRDPGSHSEHLTLKVVIYMVHYGLVYV